MALFKERLYCPVCKAWLGERFKDEFYVSHCEECKVTFTWKARTPIPTSLLDSKKAKGCNCASCSRRV